MHQELDGLPPANTPAIEVVHRPGRRWQYAPAGYTVIQAALMDIERTDFATIMQRLVLAPFGMRQSSFAQPVPAELIPAMAIPYLPDGSMLPDGPRVFIASAAGGLTTTPADLARFVLALQEALRGEAQGKLTPELARALMVRQPGRVLGPCFPAEPPGQVACRTSWGLGFDVNLTRSFAHSPDGAPTGNYFGHTGFNSGYLSLLMGSKTDGNGVVIMTNMAPLDMSGPVPQFDFLTDLVGRIADHEGWE
jgi:CubicO group peptidase (beta-lactamase class C family)